MHTNVTNYVSYMYAVTVINLFKGIVSRDFEGLQMILMGKAQVTVYPPHVFFL